MTPRFSVVLDAGAPSETVDSLGAQRIPPHQIVTWGGDASFDHVVSSCDGDVIVFCTSGDVWHPRKLFRTARAFRLEPELGAAFSDAHVSGSRASLWEAIGFGAFEKNSALTGNLFPVVTKGVDLPLGTMSIRADLRDLVLPVPDGVGVATWMLLCAALVRPYKVQTEPLLESVVPPHVQRERAALAEAVIERHQQRGFAVRPAAAPLLAELEGLAHHQRTLENLPPRGIQRSRILIDELRARNYHRYGAGVRGFFRDLVSG